MLIIGDSFAVNWPGNTGWTSALAEHYDVDNRAQAGVSEYKIYKQLAAIVNLDYDVVIVAHTSPYRVVTRQHPVHSPHSQHGNADLLLTDIEYHSQTWRGWLNWSLQAAKNFFKYHFDPDYQETAYSLFREKIHAIIAKKNIPCIVVHTPIVPDQFVTESYVVTVLNIAPGHPNHLNATDSEQLVSQLRDLIDDIV